MIEQSTWLGSLNSALDEMSQSVCNGSRRNRRIFPRDFRWRFRNLSVRMFSRLKFVPGRYPRHRKSDTNIPGMQSKLNFEQIYARFGRTLIVFLISGTPHNVSFLSPGHWEGIRRLISNASERIGKFTAVTFNYRD